MAINSTEDPQGLRETCGSVADQAEGVPLGTRVPAAAHADQEALQKHARRLKEMPRASRTSLLSQGLVHLTPDRHLEPGGLQELR